MNNCEGTSLYDHMEVDEEMVLLVVKGLTAIIKVIL
jgi:hypothetical protein